MSASIRSFDIFDTLIARKSLSPQAVFALVAEHCKTPEFALWRQQAELSLGNSAYSLHDIYLALGRQHTLSGVELASLQAEELRVELEQAIPIAQNLQRVRDGDTLITDMYLPETFIFELLHKAGLRRNVQLIRSAHGKASGEIWAGLRDGGLRATHLGDNPHSDIGTAKAAGHIAEHTQLAALSEIEQYLYRQGYTGTALLARMLRLSACDSDRNPTQEQLRLLQAQVNIPLLVVASFQLIALANTASTPITRILFSSRDCTQWLKIFRALQSFTPAHALATDYFFTSRLARHKPTADYLGYCRQQLSDGALIVDLCGTGLSMQGFLDRHAAHARCLYLFKANSPAVLNHVAPLHPGQHAGRIDYLIDNTAAPGATPTPGELLNLVDHGMTLGATLVFGGFLPRLAELEYSAEQARWIRGMSAEVERAAELIADPALREHFLIRDALVPPERAREVLATLWSLAARSQILDACFAQTHRQEDHKVHQHLLQASIPAQP